MKMKEKILSFWAINDSLEKECAIKDIDKLITSGIDGVVFHPRNYPGNPDYLSKEYFSILSEIILYCKKRNFEFWIYDENGWPSGTADGKVIEKNPNLRKEWIELVYDKREEPDFYSYQDIADGNARFVHKYEKQPSSIDKEAVETFIQIVYEGYKNGLSEDAFEYVTGFFSDETALPVNKIIPSVPWNKEMEDQYYKKTNRELENDLPALFFDDYYRKSLTGFVRISFWELAAELLINNFYKPLSEWCIRNNKHFTAHLKGEENVALSVPFSGSVCQVLKHIDIPMVDALERYQNNPFYARIASTLSKQFGEGNTFCEVMGGAGWGVEPQDVINYYKWLSECDINISCLHICQYKLNAQAIRDWPPSTPKHLSWYPIFGDVVKSIHHIYEKEKEKKEFILAVIPVRKVMSEYHAWELSKTNHHKGEVQPDTKATAISKNIIEWIREISIYSQNIHIVDEKIFEDHAELLKERVKIGKQVYRDVRIHEDCILTFNERIARFDVHKKKEEHVEKKYRSEVIKIEQNSWKLDPVEFNILPFGENYFINGRLRKNIWIINCHNINLITSNPIQYFEINGIRIKKEPIYQEEHFLYNIPEDSIKDGNNTFEIVADTIEMQPICWLRGDFAVIIDEKKQGNNCMTAIKVHLDKATVKDYRMLSEYGYPFIGSPIILRKDIIIYNKLEMFYIDFDYFEASGAQVFIDDKYAASYWNGIEETKTVCKLNEGRHVVQVRLFPSTFNLYGPHRYIGGDNKVISPLQYLSKKNLMDDRRLSESIQHQFINYKNTGIGDIIFKRREEL